MASIIPISSVSTSSDSTLPSYTDLGFDTQMNRSIGDNPYSSSSYQSLLQFQSQFEGVDTSMLTAGNVNAAITVASTSNNGVSSTGQPSTGGLESTTTGSSPTIGGTTNSFTVGSGNQSITLDGNGIYAGSTTFANAPFSIDLSGNATFNNVTLPGYIAVGGAATDVNENAGVTTIDGTSITAGTITASQISAGTITASNISASAGITAGQLSVTTLSAISGDMGTITAGSITADTITTGTLNGSAVNITNIDGSSSSTFQSNLISAVQVQTSNSGKRIVLNQTNDSLDIYSSSGLVGTIIGDSSFGIFVSSQTSISLQSNSTGQGGNLFADATGLLISSPDGLHGIQVQNSNNTLVGTTTVIGNFNVSAGTKSFDIDHPTKKGYRLNYVCLEGPEVLVFCRGVADSEEDIKYPQHFIDISEPNSIQCLVGKLKGSQKLSWFATGTRLGYANKNPEYKKHRIVN